MAVNIVASWPSCSLAIWRVCSIRIYSRKVTQGNRNVGTSQTFPTTLFFHISRSSNGFSFHKSWQSQLTYPFCSSWVAFPYWFHLRIHLTRPRVRSTWASVSRLVYNCSSRCCCFVELEALWRPSVANCAWFSPSRYWSGLIFLWMPYCIKAH